MGRMRIASFIVLAVFVLVAVLVAVGHARFGALVAQEVEELYAKATGSASIVEARELDGLPEPVARWLVRSGVVGRERARTVRLRQSGEIRTSADAAWLPAHAEQHFSVEPPGFVWTVDATMMRVVPIRGRDKLVGGHGSMLIKAASLVNVVDVADAKIDQGAMLRFLGEIVWFPSAALSPRIVWEPVDTTRAKATLQHGEAAASAVFSFDEQSRVVGLRAERYLGGGTDAALTPWLVACAEWRTFDGVEVPSRGDVGWELASGYFSYYRWEILDVQLNRRDRQL